MYERSCPTQPFFPCPKEKHCTWSTPGIFFIFPGVSYRALGMFLTFPRGLAGAAATFFGAAGFLGIGAGADAYYYTTIKGVSIRGILRGRGEGKQRPILSSQGEGGLLHTIMY